MHFDSPVTSGKRGKSELNSYRNATLSKNEQGDELLPIAQTPSKFATLTHWCQRKQEADSSRIDTFMLSNTFGDLLIQRQRFPAAGRSPALAVCPQGNAALTLTCDSRSDPQCDKRLLKKQ